MRACGRQSRDRMQELGRRRDCRMRTLTFLGSAQRRLLVLGGTRVGRVQVQSIHLSALG